MRCKIIYKNLLHQENYEFSNEKPLNLNLECLSGSLDDIHSLSWPIRFIVLDKVHFDEVLAKNDCRPHVLCMIYLSAWLLLLSLSCHCQNEDALQYLR